MTLDQLKPGQQATIAALETKGPLAQRLMALGLLEGTPCRDAAACIRGRPAGN